MSAGTCSARCAIAWCPVLPAAACARRLEGLMEFMEETGFNTLRLLLSLQNIRENKKTPRGGFDGEDSPALVGTDYIGMIEAIAASASQPQHTSKCSNMRETITAGSETSTQVAAFGAGRRCLCKEE